MKKYYLFTLAAIALAGCTADEYIGENVQGATGVQEISFAPSSAKQTRADYVGAAAAEKLNKTFTVGGYKGGTIGASSSVVTTTVFDHYTVDWTANTAGTTESNTSDWEYVGKTVNGYATANGISSQTIKYWDYSQGQYDFIAYSPSTASVVHDAITEGKLYISAITPSTATSSTGGAYTVAGATAQLEKFYIADLVTVSQANYGKEVSIKFRNITAKVRVGMYEVIPGYSVKEVKFYTSDANETGSPATAVTPIASATLYSSTANMYKKGTYTVYYPTVNSTSTSIAGYQASDMNKAHFAFAVSGDQDSYQSYGALNLIREQSSTKVENEKYLGTASNSASYATNSTDNPYTAVLPNEAATSLTLRCDYTLVADDGSKETITVHGAKAVVPAIYCQWKSNYAYTYLFKISDKTNGSTEKLGGSTEGLFPITFDAVVTEATDGIQETITTVATPSITTYQKGKIVTENDEYKAGDIYVMVQDGATLKGDLDSKGQLYTVTGSNISEATVHDALTIGATTSSTTTGRNGIALTTATSDANITAIPGADGNNITVTAKTAAKFTAALGNTYAYVYETTSGTATTTYTNTAVVLTGTTAPADWNATSNVYYSDFACETPVNSAYAAGTYYQKVSNTNKTYAVKVIRMGGDATWTLSPSTSSIAKDASCTITSKKNGVVTTGGTATVQKKNSENWETATVDTDYTISETAGVYTFTGKADGTYKVTIQGQSVEITVF